MPLERRDPALVLVLSLFTCGLYLLYWYHAVYREIEAISGEPLTGTGYGLDLLFYLLTCGVYGIFIDYRISRRLTEVQARHGVPAPADTAVGVLVLDLAAYVTGMFTNFISSAVQQDQLNKLGRWLAGER